MLQIAENIRENWILRVVVIYAVTSWLLVRIGVGEAIWTTATIVGFFCLVVALGFIYFRNSSSIEDQNFILARFVYTLAPCFIILLLTPLLLKNLPGPAIARDLQFFLLIFLGIVWYEISVPFVRSWMRDSPNPEKLMRIEEKLSYTGTLSEIMDVDPYIGTRTYYAFVAGFLSFILVFSMAAAGTIGAVVIVCASAAAMYPLHRRVSTHLKVSDSTISQSESVDLKLALSEFWRGLYDWSKPVIPHWYLVLSTILLIYAVIFVYRVVLRFIWL